MVEWQAPAIILAARPHGESDAIATALTGEHGLTRGLARGGAARANAGLWQPGNLVQLRRVARLPDQLGAYAAELVYPGAALAMEDPLALAVLLAACSVAEGALPEGETQPGVFSGLLQIITHLSEGTSVLEDLIRWELNLLAILGYGLNLDTCALTGTTVDLAWVSPRTGRAVSDPAAHPWRERLLALPGFLVGTLGCWQGWSDGLALTGHFLARDVFGAHHRDLPMARRRLADRVASMQNNPPITAPS